MSSISESAIQGAINRENTGDWVSCVEWAEYFENEKIVKTFTSRVNHTSYESARDCERSFARARKSLSLYVKSWVEKAGVENGEEKK